MKITITSNKNLVEKLQIAAGALSSKSSVSVLDNFLFSVSESELTVTATDLETTIITTLEIESDKSGVFAVSAKLLIEILKAIPDQPLTLEILPNSTMEITSTFGKYSIAYENGNDFPTLPKLECNWSQEMESAALAEVISKTIFATSTDDLRPALTGVLFEIGTKSTNFVATDAFKLVKCTRTDITTENPVSLIIPRKALQLLKNTLSGAEKVTISHDSRNAVFDFENHRVICRLIDAKYPSYEVVIPKENPNVMTIDRLQLMNSLKCVALFSDRSNNHVKFEISGQELHITGEDAAYSNKGSERLSCQYNGEDLTIGFNARFMIEMLSNLSNEAVTIEMSTPQRAGILKPENTPRFGEIMMLLMPAKI